MFRWKELLAKAQERRDKLLNLQKHYQMVEDLFLLFAKKASEFNSWFENAEEDLTDPVRCNSVEQIKVGFSCILYIDFFFSQSKNKIFLLQNKQSL